MSWPSGGMASFSSNGWKWIWTSASGPMASSAWFRELRPIAHHGHETSETKSIFRGVAIFTFRFTTDTAFLASNQIRDIFAVTQYQQHAHDKHGGQLRLHAKQ